MDQYYDTQVCVHFILICLRSYVKRDNYTMTSVGPGMTRVVLLRVIITSDVSLWVVLTSTSSNARGNLPQRLSEDDKMGKVKNFIL